MECVEGGVTINMKFSHIVGIFSFLSLLFVPFSCSADVYASALNSNESLALFGTSIPAVYYTGAGVESCTFEYVGSTFDVKQYAVDLYEAGGNGTFPYNQDIGGRGTWLTNTLNLYDDQNTPSFFNDTFIRGTNYLVYRCAFESGLPASATNFDFQIQIDTSIGIQSQGIAFSCLWTAPDSLTNRTGNNTSHLYLYNSSGFPSGEIASVIGGRPSNSDWSGRYWLGHVGVYLSDVLNYSSSNDDPRILLLNNQPAFCGCFVRAGDVSTEDAASIEFSGFRLNCKNVRSYYQYDFNWSDESIVPNGSTQYVYLLLQCPWVYGDFVIPEPDVDIGLGDINENIDNLVVSTDELRKILLRIESTNNDILSVERAHTAQFINIIDLLNDIYNNMADSGEITVPDLNDAPSIPIDSAIDSRISSEFENFDFPELQENLDQEEVSGFFGLISSFWSWIPARIITIYSIAMVLGLVSWLLFRGRGG